MKDYLKVLAKGIFPNGEDSITLSSNEINMTVEENTVATNSFSFQIDHDFAGVVYSDNDRVSLIKSTFTGNTCIIRFKVDATAYSDKEIIEAKITVESDSGEFSIKLNCIVVASHYEINQRSIYNIDDFTDLAAYDMDSAVKIFMDENFERIVLDYDNKLCNFYELLKLNERPDEAIEEFLIAAGKKEKIRLSLPEIIRLKVENRSRLYGELPIKASSDGFMEIILSTSDGLVNFELKKLNVMNFTNQEFGLPFYIDASDLHAGMNFDAIILKTREFEKRVEIAIDNVSEKPSRSLKRLKYNLVTYYLDYRSNRINSAIWIEKSLRELEDNGYLETSNLRLLLIHTAFLYMAGETAMADRAMKGINVVQGDSINYCIYLYVQALSGKSATDKTKAAASIRLMYSYGYTDFRLMWMLINLDKSFAEDPSERLTRLKLTESKGCKSPMLYYEAALTLNAHPQLLRKIDLFEYKAICLAVREKVINKNLAGRVLEIISLKKSASMFDIKLLAHIYDYFEDEDSLEILITHMIRNSVYGHEYFKYYKAACGMKLKITRLYDYYLRSMDRSCFVKLPMSLLTYYSYDTSLDDELKSYLYACIVTAYMKDTKVWNMYESLIRTYAYKQLKHGNITHNLLTIYESLWSESLVDDLSADTMMQILNTYKLELKDHKSGNVLIKHKEFKQVLSVFVTDSTAYLPMYTKDACLIYMSENGTMSYIDHAKLSPVSKEKKLFEYLFMHGADTYYVKAAILEGRTPIKLADEEVYHLTRQLYLTKDLSGYCRRKYAESMIMDYPEENNANEIAKNMFYLPSTGLSHRVYEKIAGICISAGRYDDAASCMRKYGYTYIEDQHLIDYCSHMAELYLDDISDVSKLARELDDFIIGLEYKAYTMKKDDKPILSFLNRYYNGPNENMLEILSSLDENGLPSDELAERLLIQLLFVGQNSQTVADVFKHVKPDYSKTGILTVAAATYFAQAYLIKGEEVDNSVFEVIRGLITKRIKLADVCFVAYLKYKRQDVASLSPEEKELICAIISELNDQGKCLSIFKDFESQISLPYQMLDKTYVEFIAPVDIRVSVHYRIGSEKKEHEEVCRCVGGIFTKSFTLFDGERIRYYFTYENNGKLVTSKEMEHIVRTKTPENGYNRYQHINDCIKKQSERDSKGLEHAIESYLVEDYVVKNMFKRLKK